MDREMTKDEKKALRQEQWRQELDKEKKNSFYKKLAIWSVSGLLIILAIWALVVFSQGPSSTQTSIALPKITTKDFQTNPTAKTTLVEYADFQCPACKAYYPLVKQLQSDFGNKINVVYRMFPLKDIHQNALASAKAAYSANKQGKFWEMHDLLFETQDSWATTTDPEPLFVGYAKKIGLDANQFQKDYGSSAADIFVNTAYDTAVTIGLNSTPTFFVNGKQIDNPSSYADFKKIISSAIK